MRCYVGLAPLLVLALIGIAAAEESKGGILLWRHELSGLAHTVEEVVPLASHRGGRLFVKTIFKDNDTTLPGSGITALSIPSGGGPPQHLWSVPRDASSQLLHGTPLLSPDDNNIFLSDMSQNNDVYALRTDNGEVRWRTSLPRHQLPTHAMAVSPDGAVLYQSGLNVGRGEDFLFALSATDGSVLWSTSVGRSDADKVMVTPDGSVVLFASLYRAGAVRASDGQPLWNTTAKAQGCLYIHLSGVSADSDIVYVGYMVHLSGPGRTRALRVEDGTEVWRRDGYFRLSHGLRGSAMFGQEYFTRSALMSLSGSDGSLLWNVSMPLDADTVVVSPTGRVVYAMSFSFGVLAMRASDGHELWQWDSDMKWPTSSLGPHGDVVYVGGMGDTIEAIAIPESAPLRLLRGPR